MSLITDWAIVIGALTIFVLLILTPIIFWLYNRKLKKLKKKARDFNKLNSGGINKNEIWKKQSEERASQGGGSEGSESEWRGESSNPIEEEPRIKSLSFSTGTKDITFR